jgi:hypothetical protein
LYGAHLFFPLDVKATLAAFKPRGKNSPANNSKWIDGSIFKQTKTGLIS